MRWVLRCSTHPTALRGDGGYIKSLVNIPESNMTGKMLIVLNQDLILSAVRGR